MEKTTLIKNEAANYIDHISDHIKKLSNTVALYAEPPLQEFQSSRLLSEELKSAGFDVKLGVAGLETAFTATYGSGKPVLATYAEYDATEGLSQLPVSYQCPAVQGAGGFQDMHNGIGVGAICGALAVKEIMQKRNLPGTLIVFGTPAEKLCVGKPFMAREGLFNDLDVVIAWHPGDKTEAETSWGYRFLSFHGERFIFKGVSVFGAKPWTGVSALSGVNLMDVAVQYMKGNILPPQAYYTINSITSDGGQAPTNLPGRAEAWYHCRAVTREYVEKIREGLHRCAKGAAIATNTQFETKFVSETWENLPNIQLAKVMHKNIELIGPPKFTEQDKQYAREIEKELGWEISDEPFDLEVVPPSGKEKIGVTDDFTEFCWFAPTHRVYVTYNMAKPSPSWTTASFATRNIGHQSEITAAKLISCTMIDLLCDNALLESAKKEFEERTSETKWRSLIPEDEPAPTRSPLPESHYKKMKEIWKKYPVDFIE